MPYDYRKLSPEERAALVEHRRKLGHPSHAPPHPYREAGWYLLSATNFEHRAVMREPERRDELETRLLYAFRSIDAEIGGWVVLPNHYHILVGVDSLDSVSALLKQLHGRTAREWNLADGTTGRRRVWYKFVDRWMRDEQQYFRAVNYIHHNPVKHRYVSEPYAWAWSSVHLYFDTKGRDWLRKTWKEYPTGNFGAGWDD
ncbi:MAG: transposase [Anaerolineae bacterium]|nr:transposase [Anaerolineae bacterium]